MRFRGALRVTAALAAPILPATILAVPILAVPTTTRAQPISGIYIGAGAGYNYLEDVNTKPSLPVLDSPRLNIRGNSGFGALGSIGYGLGDGWRFELEGNYRQTNINRVTGTVFPTTAGGENRTFGVMANAIFDLDIGFPWLYPYLGVGAGAAWTDLNHAYVAGTNFPFLLRQNGTGAATIAYQLIAGLSFPIPNMPGLSLTAEYRFFGMFNDQSYQGTLTSGAPPTVRSEAVKLRQQYNNSALFGVRYAFNVAPPPPPPAPAAAPAPAPARSYLVFFDWDRADLTDRAREIVAEAARNSTHVQYTRIEVNGYTDTSGKPAYNQRLSVRRAQAVAAELVRNGVPRNAITIRGFGQTHLLVPTGPGVREPQNRRVEIVLQ
jgi:OmpA-OmpF porin, OOP family